MKMDGLRFIGANVVNLPLAGAEESGPFVLKGAEGLGPTEVNVRLARTVLSKAVYQGKSSALRQITVLVALQPDYNVGQSSEQLRSELYPMLVPRYNQMLRCEIMFQGQVQAYAEGQISKMEPSYFTKDPAIQFVMDCDYSYFLHPGGGITQEPAQRNVNGIRAFDIVNQGTAPAGFRMGLILRANVGNSLVLSDGDPRGQKLQVEGINWQAGDRLVVDTREGSRGIWRGAGGGGNTTALNSLNASVSEWIQLYGGDNTLTINTNAFDWDPNYKFVHQPAYLGV